MPKPSQKAIQNARCSLFFFVFPFKSSEIEGYIFQPPLSWTPSSSAPAPILIELLGLVTVLGALETEPVGQFACGQLARFAQRARHDKAVCQTWLASTRAKALRK